MRPFTSKHKIPYLYFYEKITEMLYSDYYIAFSISKNDIGIISDIMNSTINAMMRVLVERMDNIQAQQQRMEAQ